MPQRIVQQQQGQLHQKQDRQVSLDFVDYLCIIAGLQEHWKYCVPV
jgi:hypothetical protein